MGILTDDMKRVVRQQRMGFMATVCPDGSPNLSPKGTATVWDDDRLVFADLGSPATIANLGQNPACEINEAYATGSHGIRRSGLPASRYVLMTVTKAAPLVSPGYTPGKTEESMREEWTGYWADIQKANS